MKADCASSTAQMGLTDKHMAGFRTQLLCAVLFLPGVDRLLLSARSMERIGSALKVHLS